VCGRKDSERERQRGVADETIARYINLDFILGRKLNILASGNI
jgi:hypothetical protein